MNAVHLTVMFSRFTAQCHVPVHDSGIHADGQAHRPLPTPLVRLLRTRDGIASEAHTPPLAPRTTMIASPLRTISGSLPNLCRPIKIQKKLNRQSNLHQTVL